jgi:hypothetical protein
MKSLSFRIAFVGAAALAIFGCAAPMPSTDLPPTRMVAPAREFPELRDYRGVVDLQLKGSGLDEAGIADLARAAQLDFVTLGDDAEPGSANYGTGGFTSAILFIPGGAFKIGGGEIVGANIHDPITAGSSMPALVDAIHSQGGLAIARQPSRFTSADDYALADAIEVYDQSAVWRAKSPTSLKLGAIFLGTDHFLADLDSLAPAEIGAYDHLTEGARVALVAGFGAPANMNVLGATVGTWQQLFLFYATHVLATERETDPVMDAIKQGRVYISFDFLGYVQDFAFYGESGTTKVMMGSEAPFSSGVTLKAELPDTADRIVIFKSGVEVASTQSSADFAYVPKSAGAYRVVAYRKDVPWIISNPVYLR